jgi:quercetin dioxygenase-like cupin family protein
VILADGDATGGAYTLIEATVPPAGGPSLHYHTREEEAFYLLEGEITFTVGDREIVARPGTFVQIPRKTRHAFKNRANQTARMLIHCSPAGFDKFLAETGSELPWTDSPPLPFSPSEIEKILEVAPRYGLVMLPPES